MALNRGRIAALGEDFVLRIADSQEYELRLFYLQYNQGNKGKATWMESQLHGESRKLGHSDANMDHLWQKRY